MALLLRGYQERGTVDIKAAFAAKYRAPLYVGPTGSGKTALFSAIAHGAAAKGNRILILSHRIELVDQISEALKRSDTAHGFIAAGYEKGDAQCLIASVQTLIRRLDKIQAPQLIIVDEAHHAIMGNTWGKILEAYPQAKVLGFTATPCRLDGRGLGANFDVLIRGPSEEELIQLGYLARVRIFSPKLVDTSGLHIRMKDYVAEEADALVDKPEVVGDAFSHYMQHTPYQQAIVFATSVRNAENCAKRFRDGGVPALSLNGGTDKTIRRMAFDDYRAGKIKVVATCNLANEGVDIPGASVGIMLRPTKSLQLYRQQRGRIMRPAPGKEFATLLDCVRNCENPGFELLPGEVDDWQLELDSARGKRKPPPGVRICPKCFAANSPRARECVECHAQFEVQSREVAERDGELAEVTAEELAKKRERRDLGFEQSKADSVEKLVEVFRKRGFKGDLAGRARHVLAARQAKKAANG